MLAHTNLAAGTDTSFSICCVDKEDQDIGLLADTVPVERPYNVIYPFDGGAVDRQNEVSLLKTSTFDGTFEYNTPCPRLAVCQCNLQGDPTVQVTLTADKPT